MQSNSCLGWVLLLALTHAIKIPCQFTASNWPTGLRVNLSERQAIVSTRYNFDMIIDPLDRTVSQTISDTGVWQPTQIHIIAHFLKPGHAVLNLGPQSGLQAIVMGKLIGPSGRLYIVQPNSLAYSMVRKNIYLNDLEAITRLYRVGASDVQAEHLMVTFSQNTGAARIYNFANHPADLTNRDYHSEVVKVDLMDNVIPNQQQIDFMLIDVEKMEVQALLGMKQLIERSSSLVMMVEWQYAANELRNQAKTLRCLKWLLSLKFKFYRHRPVGDNRCEVGQFSQVQVIELMRMQGEDIVIARGSVDPNNM